jgi:hypothetical protein
MFIDEWFEKDFYKQLPLGYRNEHCLEDEGKADREKRHPLLEGSPVPFFASRGLSREAASRA